jgi:hypothetical protein
LDVLDKAVLGSKQKVVTRIEVTEGLKRSPSENWLERNVFVCGGREGGRGEERRG